MITAFDDPRIELARQTIGTVRVVPDPSLPGHLLRLVDNRGTVYLAKQHAQAARYVQETHAYLTWSRLLPGQLPELVGHHDGSHTLLLTALPGQSAEEAEPDTAEEVQAHHEAGRRLGRLHRATSGPSAEGGALGAELAGRLEAWVERGDRADLLSAVERHRLLSVADQLPGTHMDSAVCHLDYQPRNWLIGDGDFWICDLEHMRRDARVRDFARLEFRRWQAAPRLRDAFFTGYGARPTGTDQRLLESFGAIEAITALVRGHEQDDVALSTHGRTVLSRLV